MPMEAFVTKNPGNRSEIYGVEVSQVEIMASRLPEMVMARIAELIAQKFVEEHWGEIVAKLDQQAIANVAIAQAGAEINKTLKEKIPDKVLEIEKSTVYQRGIFGGLSRIR